MLFKLIFGIVLAAGLYLTFTAWLGSSPQEAPAPQTNQTDQKAKSTKNYKTAFGAAIERGFIRQAEFIHDFREEIVAVGTLFIAAFTVILAFATGFLYLATRELVEGADKTAEKQLRAYIGLHSMETTVYPFEKGGYAFIAHAELRNYGQTPAYDLTVKSNVKIDTLENVPFDNFPGVERGVPSIAFRDVGFHVNVGWQISEEDKIALYERKKVFFFWGRVDYSDAFGKPHHFTFNLVSGHTAAATGGVYTMGPYGPGYEADKE